MNQQKNRAPFRSAHVHQRALRVYQEGETAHSGDPWYERAAEDPGAFLLDRLRHAEAHLANLRTADVVGEDDLSKIRWWCDVAMYVEHMHGRSARSFIMEALEKERRGRTE